MASSPFASRSVATHLIRGFVGLAALVAAFAALGPVGPLGLLLDLDLPAGVLCLSSLRS